MPVGREEANLFFNATPGSDVGGAHDADLRGPRLAPIMLIIVAIIPVAAVPWALLV